MDKVKDKAQIVFEECLDDAITHNRYVKLQYFTDFHEFISLMAVTQEIINKDNQSYLRLNTGEEIRTDKIVKIDDIYAPKYAHISDFTCDC